MIRQGALPACVVAAALAIASPAGAIEACPQGHAQRRTCVVDGDTGWQAGRKWRLLSIDAPEISHPACPAEREAGLRSRDRLVDLMNEGYRVRDSGRKDVFGRKLVDIRLRSGEDAGRKLLDEGLAQPWPNRTNPWCRRR